MPGRVEGFEIVDGAEIFGSEEVRISRGVLGTGHSRVRLQRNIVEPEESIDHLGECIRYGRLAGVGVVHPAVNREAMNRCAQRFGYLLRRPAEGYPVAAARALCDAEALPGQPGHDL